MFITAMAANPLAVNLAASAGINISWGTWALAGLVPGIVCLICVPLILYALYPPEVRAGCGQRNIGGMGLEQPVMQMGCGSRRAEGAGAL